MHDIIYLIFFKHFIFITTYFQNLKLQFNIPNVKINYYKQNKTSVVEFQLTYNEKKSLQISVM